MNKDLNDILGKETLKSNPFRVPEGYFDSLNDRIMSAIPQDQPMMKAEPTKAKVVGLRQLRWAAAVACVMIAGVTFTLYGLKSSSKVDELNADIASKYLTPSDDAFTQAADYVMMDNQDVYQLLAED